MDLPGGCFSFLDREEYSLMKGGRLEGQAGPARGERKGLSRTCLPPGSVRGPDTAVSSGVAARERPSAGSPALRGPAQGRGHLHPWTGSHSTPRRAATCPAGQESEGRRRRRSARAVSPGSCSREGGEGRRVLSKLRVPAA